MELLRTTEIESVLNPSHVVILHDKLLKRNEDRYLTNLAGALEFNGHNVTIITSEFDKNNCLDELNSDLEKLNIMFSGWWLPRSFLGLFRNVCSVYRAAWMAFRIALFPPKPNPVMVILDVNPIAVLILALFTRFTVVYVEHFSMLQDVENYSRYIKVTPSLFSARFLKYANEIIVPSDCLADIFKRSYPKVRKEVNVFYPTFDTMLWSEDTIDINRIIPDLPKNFILFSAFGQYKPKSNFMLATQAFEHLLVSLDSKTKRRVHLVFAYNTKRVDERCYYNDLIKYAKEKNYASQITFLRQLPVVHKKTIIASSMAVLHTTKHDIFPGPIIAAMGLRSVVIATNTGTAPKIITHRLSGILVDPLPQKFAAAMLKLIMKPALSEFIRDMAADVFKRQYSFDGLSRKVEHLVEKYEVRYRLMKPSLEKLE